MLTELDKPVHLDLSMNKFTDESIYPFVKYLFANEDCQLNFFSLEHNSLFSNYGKRTLLKAYALSPNKASIHFRLSPLPCTDSTLKHAFTTSKKAAQSERFEVVISRRPNYSGLGLRSLPIQKVDRDRLATMLIKLEGAVANRQTMPIEDMRDILQEVS
jgi:hypothetical protein